MATFDPLKRAQDVKRCQLCLGKDRKSAAETVCNTCQINLCKDCVGHHMASNPTIRHDVVTFQFKKMEIIPPRCTLHQRHICEMFCEQCVYPICRKCLASGSHEYHDVLQISEIHRSRQRLIKEDTKELETNIAPVFESILSEIEEMLSNVVRKHGQRQHTIIEFGKKCHTRIDIVINRYLDESNEIAMNDGDLIQTLKSEFEGVQLSIESTIHENYAILASNDLSKFTSYTSRIEEFRNVPSRFELTVPPLDLKDVTEWTMRQVIGAIPISTKTNIPGQVLEVVHLVPSAIKPNIYLLGIPEVLAALNTNYLFTVRVCCVPNTDQFYVTGDNNIIKHMDTDGTLLAKIITKSGHDPYDITVIKDGYLMYTDCKDRSINIHNDEEISCLIRVRGWRPWAICNTSTSEFLVTMRSDNDNESKVVRYFYELVTQEIQYSDTGEALYYNPCSITENKNLDVVVSDWYTNTVVVVDKKGKFRFSYDGNLHSIDMFTPYGVTTDSMGHILIADHDNHIIHIIDHNGQFLQHIDNCNLQQPFDLNTDSNDMLFVTECETNLLKQIKY